MGPRATGERGRARLCVSPPGGAKYPPAQEGGVADNRSRRTAISGKDARQGEIILRTPFRRFIFIAGLVAAVIVALAFSWLRF